MGDRVAFVTGGGSGIGRAVALAFARQGMRVALADVDARGGHETVALIEREGGRALFLPCDVSRASDVEAAVAATVAQFGALTCACNSAGIHNKDLSLLADSTEETWDAVLGVNLKGTYLCLKYEIRELLKTGGGAIVNIASVAGLIAEPAGGSAYTASKHGVVGLTKAAALEYAKKGIRVNAICPAFIDTPMVAAGVPEEMRPSLAAMHPVGRFGTPEEVAGTVLWLCSDAAAFVTGATLAVDGGLTAQ